MFPEDYDIVEAGDKTAGCFRDGNFMLTSDMAGFTARDLTNTMVEVGALLSTN